MKKIEPSEVIKKLNVPEYCVITSFGDVIKKMESAGRLKKLVNSLHSFYRETDDKIA